MKSGIACGESEAVVAVVAIVSVVENEELEEMVPLEGLSAQVGGALGVPVPS